jgi:hypothetical protein
VLAETIKQKDAAHKVKEDTHAARERARQVLMQVEDETYDTKQKLNAVREADAQALEAAVRAGSDIPPSGYHQAKLRVAELEDRVVAAQAAVTNLEVSLKSYQVSLDEANRKCEGAAKSVVASELGTHWVDELRQARDEFESRVAVLGWLVRSKILEDYDREANKPLHHDVFLRQGSAAADLLRDVGYNAWATRWLKDVNVMDRLPGVMAWKDCLNQLQKDPDTPLPRSEAP